MPKSHIFVIIFLEQLIELNYQNLDQEIIRIFIVLKEIITQMYVIIFRTLYYRYKLLFTSSKSIYFLGKVMKIYSNMFITNVCLL